MNVGKIPGTHEPGWEEPRILETSHRGVREMMRGMGSRGVRFFKMGEASIILCREPAGANGELLWHLSISCTDRHPSWDEIKTARYRLLPLDLCFGMLLPQPEFYVNVPQQDHTFHLHEVLDLREPWTSG